MVLVGLSFVFVLLSTYIPLAVGHDGSSSSSSLSLWFESFFIFENFRVTSWLKSFFPSSPHFTEANLNSFLAKSSPVQPSPCHQVG